MNTDDNNKLNKSWTTLNEEPDYYELFLHLQTEEVSHTYNYIEGFVNNFFKFGLDGKFVFPNEIYNYPTFINISFHSCPLVLKIHLSNVTAIIFCNRCHELHVTYNIRPSVVMDWCGWEHMATIL